jgi:hypothetical protein
VIRYLKNYNHFDNNMQGEIIHKGIYFFKPFINQTL